MVSSWSLPEPFLLVWDAPSTPVVSTGAALAFLHKVVPPPLMTSHRHPVRGLTKCVVVPSPVVTAVKDFNLTRHCQVSKKRYSALRLYIDRVAHISLHEELSSKHWHRLSVTCASTAVVTDCSATGPRRWLAYRTGQRGAHLFVTIPGPPTAFRTPRGSTWPVGRHAFVPPLCMSLSFRFPKAPGNMHGS